eukprot:6183415-Pyramimonas_sp.AAC.1
MMRWTPTWYDGSARMPANSRSWCDSPQWESAPHGRLAALSEGWMWCLILAGLISSFVIFLPGLGSVWPCPGTTLTRRGVWRRPSEGL